MPVHDWSKVDANLFHEFHQCWAMKLHDTLNRILPDGYSALVEQHAPVFVPDVLTVERRANENRQKPKTGRTVTLPKPKTRFTEAMKERSLAKRGNRIAIHHGLGNIVCILEIVSPGNKRGRKALGDFVDKTTDFLDAGINVVLIDLLPPNNLAPAGLHRLIWLEPSDSGFELTDTEPLLLAAYRAEAEYTNLGAEAFLERVAVGAALPDMPAFIEPDFYVNVPLEATYMEAWNSCPKDMRYLIEHGMLPED
jgi:hypothetical protein